jgi:hypothetical protein
MNGNPGNQYELKPDEHCPFCYSRDLLFVGVDEGGYWGGMACDELRCQNCDSHFAVNCDDIPTA